MKKNDLFAASSLDTANLLSFRHARSEFPARDSSLLKHLLKTLNDASGPFVRNLLLEASQPVIDASLCSPAHRQNAPRKFPAHRRRRFSLSSH